MRDHKLSTGECNIKPLFFVFHLVVEGGEHPNLPALEPHEFVSIVDFSFVIDAGEETSILFIDGVLLPKGDNLVKKLLFVHLGICFELFLEIHFLHPQKIQ